MSYAKNKRLLREYIRQSLLNEDMGGFGGGDMGGPYGMDYTGGDQSKLAKVFLTPFTDVVKTATGKAKEVSTKAQTVAKVAIEAIATSVIPVISSDFDRIFDEEKQQIDKLRSEYKDVYDRTWTAIQDNDIMAAAFAYAPSAMVTAAAIKNAPIPVMNTLNVLTGGKLDGFIEKMKKKLKLGDEQKMTDRDTGSSPFESRTVAGKLLHEKLDIAASLQQKKIKELIAANPKVQRMSQEAKTTVRDSLEKLYDRLRRITKAATIDELETILGEKIDGSDNVKKLQGNERQDVEKMIVQSVLQGAKSLYAKNIEKIIKSSIEAGVPEDHPLIDDYKKALQKIKAA